MPDATRASSGRGSASLRLLARARSALRIDDLALFAWLAVIQPLTLGNHTHAISDLGKQGTPWGAAYLVSAGGAIICLASRSPDEPTLAWTTPASPHSYAPLPFVVAVAIFASFGMQDVGAASSDVVFLPAIVLALAAFFLYADLPTLPAALRRVAVLPMALVSSAVFNGVMFELFSSIDRNAALQIGLGMPLFLALTTGLFYSVFILSPAQIADAGGSWPHWWIRYGLFVAGSLVGVSVIGAMRG